MSKWQPSFNTCRSSEQAPDYKLQIYSVFSSILEGSSMDYSEVSSAFSKLVETHFLQRCPPMVGTGTASSATPATPATPSTPGAAAAPAPVSSDLPTPESFPDCYKVPHVTLIGRGKRRHSGEDGEDQRNAKKAKLEVGILNTFAST